MDDLITMEYEFRQRDNTRTKWGPWQPLRRYTNSLTEVLGREGVETISVSMVDGKQFEYRVVVHVLESDHG